MTSAGPNDIGKRTPFICGKGYFHCESGPMKITCIVVEDVKLNRDVMADLISSIDSMELMGSFENASEATNALSELEPDVMFLDIEMPGMSGLDFLKSLTHPPLTVLTTSHAEFAVEGFEMNVFDYLVKPISRERFARCANKLQDHFKSRKAPLLANQMFIKANNRYLRIKLADIVYVEANRDFVIIYTDKTKYAMLSNLKEFSARLPEDQFMRIHRSYLVPIGKIEIIEGNMVKIANHEIPIGDSYKNNVMKTLLGNNH